MSWPPDRAFLAAIAAQARLIKRRDRDRATLIVSAGESVAERIVLGRHDGGNIFLVRWLASEAYPHTRPWGSAHLILTVGYWEVTAAKRRLWRAPGDAVFHKATERFFVELEEDRTYTAGAKPMELVLTLPDPPILRRLDARRWSKS